MAEILDVTVTGDYCGVEVQLRDRTVALGVSDICSFPYSDPFEKIKSVTLYNSTGFKLTLEDGTEGFVSSRFFDDSSAADLVIVNASQLLDFPGGKLTVTEDGAVAVSKGKIVKKGTTSEVLNSVELAENFQIIDASGCVVSPGLVDCHTHPVFHGDRSREFAMRLAGSTYDEILNSGGGIHNTVLKTREASDDVLFQEASERLSTSLCGGVTSFECKSGYALNYEDEIRTLKILKSLGQRMNIDISATLLAAHVIPMEFKDNRDEYIKLILDKIIPEVGLKNLATTVDVFCEENAFTLDETKRIFKKAQEYNLGTRVHAGQFTSQGAVKLAAESGSLSVDHLEVVSDEELNALATSRTVATLLPGAAFNLGMKMPDARRFLERGIRVALATDMNPGTSMTVDLPMMMSFGCLQMGMTVEQAWEAVTVNAAAAAGLYQVGALYRGNQADLVIWNFSHYGMLPYYSGKNHTRQIIKKGKIIPVQGSKR
ncbi:MAG: imidazolonepropionase [Deltaproteobacteria bacterium]|nr:imidazolonepropionase [Deltaproteobacteria bacterium]